MSRFAASVRKKLLISLCVLAAAVLLLLVLVPLILHGGRGDDTTPDFADPALSADIYADADYMALDRSVTLVREDGYTHTERLADDAYSSQPAEVQLLLRLLMAMRAGDAESYNACFSPEYLRQAGAQASFTMQKVYAPVITQYAAIHPAVPDGYTAIGVWGLSYKIKDNNGSLRRDIGSDAAREQYLYLVTDGRGNVSIYAVRTVKSR